MSTGAFEIAQAVLISLGGGGLIVLVLSSWIGKIWAQRILLGEKQEYEKQLTEFKSKLESLKEKDSLNYQQKLELYKLVANPFVELTALINRDGVTEEHVHEFNRQRLHITAQLVLFAPESVVHAFMDIIDYIYNSFEQKNYDFHVFRDMAMKFLSEMRKDIGIYSDEVTYAGSR